MTKKVNCDWCHGGGSIYTDCGNETCDHCGGSGKIKFSKTCLVYYGDFDSSGAMGYSLIIPTSINILLGFRLLDAGGLRNDLPLITVESIRIA